MEGGDGGVWLRLCSGSEIEGRDCGADMIRLDFDSMFSHERSLCYGLLVLILSVWRVDESK
jgi:hypothetical protein